MNPDRAPAGALGRGPALFLLAALAATTSWLHASWCERNGFFERPFTSDAAWYRVDALQMKKGFDDGGLLGWLGAGLAHDRPHPPFVVMTAGLVAALRGDAGVSPYSAFLAIQFFAALYLAGTYRLARRFVGRAGALGAAALAASFPGIVAHWRPLYPQFPMCAALVWCFEALLATDGFGNRRASLRFGFLAGAATMIKMLAPLYFAGAAAAALGAGLAARTGSRGRTLGNVLLGAAAAALVMAPWYAPHLDRVLGYADEVTGAEGQTLFSASLPAWSAPRWLFYPWHLLNGGLGWFFAPLFVAAAVGGGAALVRARRFGAPGAILAAAPLGAYVPLTLGQTAAGPFYLSGYLPLAAVLLVAYVAEFRRPVVRGACVAVLGGAVVLVHGLAQRPPEADVARPMFRDFPALRFAAHPAADGILPLDLLPRADGIYGSFLALGGGVGRRPAESWPNERIIDAIAALAPRPTPVVAQTTPYQHTHPYCGHPQLQYAALRRGLSLKYWKPEDWSKNGLDPLAEAAKCDFLVVDERPLPGLFPAEVVIAGLRAKGADGEILFREHPTPLAPIALVQVKRAGVVAGPRPNADLELPGVRRMNVAYENGWTLVGARQAAGAEQAPVLNLWFSGAADCEAPVLARAHLHLDGKFAAAARGELKPIVAGPADGGAERLFAVSFEGLPRPPEGRVATLHVRVESKRPAAYQGHARVRATDERRRGEAAIELPYDLSAPKPAPAASRPTSQPASRPGSRPASRPTTRAAPGGAKPTSRPASTSRPRGTESR